MFYDTQESDLPVPHPELLSIRRLETLRRHGSVTRTTTLPPLSGSLRRPEVKRVNTLPQQEAGLDNPAMDLYEQALQLDSVVVVHPDVFHDTEEDDAEVLEDIARAQQIDGLRRTLGKAVSLAPRNSVKGKAHSLPSTTDFNQNWEGIESYINKQLKDSEPVVFTPYRKPFHQRTWFAMTLYISLALGMVALILGIASFIAIILPNQIIQGQILPMTTTPEAPAAALLQEQDSTTPTTVDATSSTEIDTTTRVQELDQAQTTWTPVQEDSDQITTTEVISTTTQSPVSTSTLMSTKATVYPTTTERSDDTTTSGWFFAPVSVPTTTTPLVPTTSPHPAPASDWLYLLNLPGPMQRGGNSNGF